MAHLNPSSDLQALRHADSFTLPSTANTGDPIIISYMGGMLNFFEDSAFREVAERQLNAEWYDLHPEDVGRKTRWSSMMAIYRLPFIFLSDSDTKWNVEVVKNPFDPTGAPAEWVLLEKTEENANKRLLPSDIRAWGEKLWADCKVLYGIADEDTVEYVGGSAASPLATTTPELASPAPVDTPSTDISTESQSPSTDETSSSSDFSSPTNSEESSGPTADA